MQFLNEHAARQRSPSDFEKFQRGHPAGWPDGVDAIFGYRPHVAQIQSIRFDSTKWSPDAARQWLKSNGFSAAGFEASKSNPHANKVQSAQHARLSIDGVAESQDGKDVKLRFTVCKVDKYEQKMFGWLYICRNIDGAQVVDHSREVISIKTLEVASYRYVHEHRKMGDMHKRTADNKVVECGHLIECMVFTPEKRSAMAESLGLSRDTFEKLLPDGMWVGYQITDPETWADVLSGKKRSLSLGGRARRIPLAQGAPQ